MTIEVDVMNPLEDLMKTIQSIQEYLQACPEVSPRSKGSCIKKTNLSCSQEEKEFYEKHIKDKIETIYRNAGFDKEQLNMYIVEYYNIRSNIKRDMA